MTCNPDKHHRRTIRVKAYNYSRPGGYFVTVCAQGRKCAFGEIVDGGMSLNRVGEIAKECWERIPQKFPGVTLDEYTVMPNHFHGIVIIGSHLRRGDACVAQNRNDTKRARHASPLQPCGPAPGSIGAIIGSFKSAVTKRINEMRGTPVAALWQRNYYERIIRDEEELADMRKYIRENSLRWDIDGENPVKRT